VETQPSTALGHAGSTHPAGHPSPQDLQRRGDARGVPAPCRWPLGTPWSPYLLPDVVVAEEAADLALGERAAGEGVIVPGELVYPQHLDVAAVEGAARQGAA